MDSLIQSLFFVLLTALVGGIIAKKLKLPNILGYILAGVLGGTLLPYVFPGQNIYEEQIEGLAQLGIILLLFSVGLELSLDKLLKFGKIAIVGAAIQIILVTGVLFLFLSLFHLPPTVSFILAFGFSLSSTAVVIKILDERGETDTVHGGIMIGWLLVQDLAVIPMVVLLPALSGEGSFSIIRIILSLASSLILLVIIYILGRKIAPYLLRKLASTNSKELLILGSVSLALGVAEFVSLFGISAAFGAFLAGIVISQTQENHAVFAETRPLRDLFVILFFVSLGFLVSPAVIISNFGAIIALSLLVLLSKAVITYLISLIYGYRGKTAVANSLGLAQIGEFSFLLFLIAKGLNLFTPSQASIGMATTLATLVIAPLVYKSKDRIYQLIRKLALKHEKFNILLVSKSKKTSSTAETFQNHIIVCGYGRVGSWIVKALKKIGVAYVVIDSNHTIVREARKSGVPIIFGDSSEAFVLQSAGIANAKGVVIAFPDTIAQEQLISYLESNYKDIKIIVRAHLDEDVKKLTTLRVRKVVQPEFEGALAVVKQILIDMGKSKEEVSNQLKTLRQSHSIIK